MSLLPIQLLSPTAKLPTKAHPGDAGLDLYADEPAVVYAGKTAAVRTGIAVAIPAGHAAFLRGRSGLSAKGVAVGAGLIDSGYRGEWAVVLHGCHGPFPVAIERGDRIAQFVVLPVPEFTPTQVAGLPEGDRGQAGFGSTGL